MHERHREIVDGYYGLGHVSPLTRKVYFGLVQKICQGQTLGESDEQFFQWVSDFGRKKIFKQTEIILESVLQNVSDLDEDE